MGKASSITLVSAVGALIAFSTFITAYPHGIKIFDGYDVHYEGKNILFYGSAEGNAYKLVANNYSAIINNDSKYGNEIKIEGDLDFNCQQAVLNGTKGIIFTNKTAIEGKNCKINGEFYGEIEGEISGDISIFYVSAYLKEGERIKYENESFAIINRIFLITGGNFSINGKKIQNFSKILFRGEGEITTGKFDGKAYFVIIDSNVYEEVKKKIFIFPVEIIILWIIAVALFILSSFVKKNFFKEFDKSFKGFSIVMAILFFAISFYLWNSEMDRILGINIINLLKEITIYSVFFSSLSLIPYIVVVALIGFPVRIAISSVFEIFGLSYIGKGIGRGVGFMLVVFLGISLLPSIIKITLAPLLTMH